MAEAKPSGGVGNNPMDGGSRLDEARREIVVVTGASSGIGAAGARELAQRGFHVLAGVRRAEDGDALRCGNIEPIILDITNEADIGAVLERVTNDPDRRLLRALVNNAGIAINAPAETLPLSEWRNLFEINLFGHVAMMQALLPALIKSRGTVVNISSIGGRVAMATYGPYASSKFALEAVSDALRREVGPLGVKVVVVEPAAVRTGMLDRVADRGERVITGMTVEQRRRYAPLMQAVVAQAQAAMPDGISADTVGRVIADAVTSRRPRSRYTIGRNAAMVVLLARLLPDRLLDRLLASNLKPYLIKAEAVL